MQNLMPDTFPLSLSHVDSPVPEDAKSNNETPSAFDKTVPRRNSLLLCLLRTTEQTCPSGSNKTRLLTLRRVSRDSRGLTDMLMVTLAACVSIFILFLLAFHRLRLTPPWGWSTGFMATPRVLGHELRLTANLCLAREAFRRGLSVRPPPATIPIIPRELLLTTFLAPEGSLTRVLPSSGLWPTMVT